uniref:Complement C8 gamma chain n=1 Tax=Suricata suricatta TaxID=37032 RepID=A0A673VPX9_SURSU
MLTPRTAFLLTLLLAGGSLSRRARRPSRPASPISTIQPKANFDAQQFAGTWLLVAVASSCRFLQEEGHQAEATSLHVAPQGAAMAVSTLRKLDGICWQVRQLYGDTGVKGRFLLQARGARGPVDVVVGDTDYRGFAILYLEQARRLSVKLYGAYTRSPSFAHTQGRPWGTSPDGHPAPSCLPVFSFFPAEQGPGGSPCTPAQGWGLRGWGRSGCVPGTQTTRPACPACSLTTCPRALCAPQPAHSPQVTWP